jgi:hypothetical protein
MRKKEKHSIGNTPDGRKKMLSNVIKRIVFCIMISGFVNETLWSMERYDVGDDWDNQSIQSYGFSDSASTIRGGGAPLQPQDLTALTELRRHFFKGYLEITPDNIESIQQYTLMYESSFGRYTGGVYVKRWKTSADRESLQEFLFKFTEITKFKMEPVWDRDDEDFAEILIRSVQFFNDLGELTIAGCRLTDGHMEDILESIPNPGKLRILDIRNNPLSVAVLPRIQERLPRLADLKTELYAEEAKKQAAEEQERRLLLEQQQQREAAAQRERIKQQEERKQKELKEEEEKRTQQQRMAEERRQKELAEEAERQQQLMVSRRPKSIPIPEIARGYEEIYRLFYNGKLVYKPDPNSDAGRIDLPIASLSNPLEGRFDLSRCGDTWKYLSIHTGYKKGYIAENKDKVEIWFVPRFMVEREISSTARHLQPIMDRWSAMGAPIGIIWTWWNDDLKYYDYLTTQAPENLSDNNLYEKWVSSWGRCGVHVRCPCWSCVSGDIADHSISFGGAFHVHFVNKDES